VSLPLRLLLTVPRSARRGEIIEVRALAQHAMENGLRHDQNGQVVARDLLRQVAFLYNGVEVFRADLHTGVAANPLLQFNTIARESGVLTVIWKDDEGRDAQMSARIEVS
jgi:sulfur-oxidizing protein SoxZ